MPGDLLVANESRVIPARLYGRKAGTGGRVELLLIARRAPDTWEALVRGRKLGVGTKIEVGGQGQEANQQIANQQIGKSALGTRQLAIENRNFFGRARCVCSNEFC